MFIYLYSRWFFNYRYCIVFVTILVYGYDIKQDSGSGSDSMFKLALDYYFKFNVWFQQVGDLFILVSHEDH